MKNMQSYYFTSNIRITKELMPNLQRFSLGSCSCIRLSAISPPSLTHLNLSNINFVNYPRGLLSAQEFPISILSETLKHLVLHNTEFNSKFLKSIYKCKKIEYLDISKGSTINYRRWPNSFLDRK